LRDGLKAADLYLKSDARVGTEAILAGLDRSSAPASRPRRRSAPKSWRIASPPSPRLDGVRRRAGLLDPRKVIDAIDAVVPKDWDIVVGGGHQAYFNAQMRGRPAGALHHGP